MWSVPFDISLIKGYFLKIEHKSNHVLFLK